jgi:glutamate racemase
VSRRIGVLGTERTVADPYIGELAARYGKDCAVIALAAPDLVEWVEYRHIGAAAGERLKAVEPYVDYFRKQGADALVLGCTHFLFLLDEFKAAAGPGITVYDSMEGVSRRIEAVLDKAALRASPETTPSAPAGLLIVTGPYAEDGVWQERAREFGFVPRSFGGPA